MTDPNVQAPESPDTSPDRRMTPAEFSKLPEQTQDEAAKAWQAGTLRAAEPIIQQQLTQLLATPAADGTVPKIGDVVVVLMHAEDPIVPDELRIKWLSETPPREVGVFVLPRIEFAQSIAKMAPKDALERRPYLPAAKVLLAPPPAGSTYATVFSHGKNSTFLIDTKPAEG